MSGEFDFIDWVRSRNAGRSDIPVPPGDDLAVLSWPSGDSVVVGADQVLDGVHVDTAIHSPRDIGRKAMNRNLSDCAAMGCLPTAAVVTMALPRGVGAEFAQSLYLGLEDAASAFDCRIVGGDTGSWGQKLAVIVAILGRMDGVAPVTRSRAHVGDGIYVTGPLGGSILGRHLTFSPRVATGRAVAASGLAGAMIDLSDGLSRDLAHLCRESDVGASVAADRVPIHPDAVVLQQRDGKPALEHAFHDGEDYELLMTLRAGAPAERLAESLGLTRIGIVIAESGVWLERSGTRTLLETRAWQHVL